MSDTKLEKVLIIDDNSDYRKLIKTFINKLLPGVETIELDPVFDGVPDDSFDWSEIDVLLLDYHLAIVGTTGLDVLHKHHKKHSFPATIMLTGAGTEETAIRALKSGIYEYQPKQSLTKDKLKQSIIHAWEDKKSQRKKKQEITQHSRSFSKEVFYEMLEQAFDEKGTERALIIIRPDDINILEEEIGIIGRDNLVNHIAKNSFEVFKLGACNPNITRISDSEIGVQIDFPINQETLEFNMQGLSKHLSKCAFKFSDEKYKFSVSIGVLKLGVYNEPAEQLIFIASAACDQASKTKGNSHYIWKETDVIPEATKNDIVPNKQTIDNENIQKAIKEKEDLEIQLKAAADAKEKAEATIQAEHEAKVKLEADLKIATEAKEKAEAESKSLAEAELKAQEEIKLHAKHKKEEAEQAAREKTEKESKAQAELRAEQEARQRIEVELKAEAEAKAKVEAELRAEQETQQRIEAELKAEAEAKAKVEAELKAEAEAKAKVEAEIRAEQEAQQRIEAELKSEAEAKAKVEAEIRAEQEAQQRIEAELKSEAEAKAKVEAEIRAEQEAQQRIEAELKSEAEAKAKVEAEAELKAAKEDKDKLESELKAIAEAKEKAEAEMRVAKEAKEKLESELKAIAEAKEKAEAEIKITKEESKKADINTETNIDITEEPIEPSQNAPDEKQEEIKNPDIETPQIESKDIENQIRKLIDEKRIIQTYQPVTAMFDDENETKEIYKTGLQAIIEDEKLNEYLSDTSIFSISLQQIINEWILRQVFLRITESGTAKCRYLFLIRVTESWFSDITLFSWLQKILSQTKKYNPGKSIILEVPLDIFNKHMKRAKALIDTLYKSHQFSIALTNMDVMDNIVEDCEITSSSLLMMNLEQLNKLTEILAPHVSEENEGSDEDDEECKKQNMLQFLKSKNIRIITTGIEDSTLLTDAITAGTDYTLGNFVGEIQDNLFESQTVESFELT
jgi:CheY-like chemotaxis protein